jgi:phytoene desaturase
LVKNGKTIGVRLKEETVLADAVVVACDYKFAETQMLEAKDRTYDEKYWDKRVLAPSALIIYLGIKGKIKRMTHHLLYFDDSWERHFDEVYSDPVWPDKPSYYVHCPSKTDASVAPAGCDALMILVPVSAGLEDTPDIRQKFRQKILEHLEGVVGEKLEKRIVTERIYTHRDFAADYNAFRGTAFGLAHTLGQTAIFRPRNYSRKVNNLYYAGQYTNPGVGVPVGLISAQIVASLVEKEI